MCCWRCRSLVQPNGWVVAAIGRASTGGGSMGCTQDTTELVQPAPPTSMVLDATQDDGVALLPLPSSSGSGQGRSLVDPSTLSPLPPSAAHLGVKERPGPSPTLGRLDSEETLSRQLSGEIKGVEQEISRLQASAEQTEMEKVQAEIARLRSELSSGT
jgi:hypothetical protein